MTHTPTFQEAEIIRCRDCGVMLTAEAWARELCPARFAPPVPALEPAGRMTIDRDHERSIYGHRR
jgi:hypothetical protein